MPLKIATLQLFCAVSVPLCEVAHSTWKAGGILSSVY